MSAADDLRLAIADPNATTPRLPHEHIVDWQVRAILAAGWAPAHQTQQEPDLAGPGSSANPGSARGASPQATPDQVEHLRAERDEWHEICARMNTRFTNAEAERDALAATVERVRALCGDETHWQRSGVVGAVRLSDLRAALDEGGQR